VTVVTFSPGPPGTPFLVPSDWTTQNVIIGVGPDGGETVPIGAANLIPGSTVYYQLDGNLTVLLGNNGLALLTAYGGGGPYSVGSIVATYSPQPAKSTTLYQPSTGVSTRSIPYASIVSGVDPWWQRAKYREIEYEMSNNRRFLANPATRGAYNNNQN
jgi:hypothetical protein